MWRSWGPSWLPWRCSGSWVGDHPSSKHTFALPASMHSGGSPCRNGYPARLGSGLDRQGAVGDRSGMHDIDAQIRTAAQGIAKKFTPEILRKVSELSSEGLTDENHTTSMADAVFVADLERNGQPYYTIEPDSRAKVSFPLKGNIELFEEYFQALFPPAAGVSWTIDGSAVSVIIQGARREEDFKPKLYGLPEMVGEAIQNFNMAVAGAKTILWSTVNNAIADRAKLEAALAAGGYQKGLPLPLGD